MDRPLWHPAPVARLAAAVYRYLLSPTWPVASHTGVAIYLLRISYCCAVAGIYGASMTFISMCGPSRRLAELVGMLGTAGFLGTVAGTLLGDFLIDSVKANRTQVVEMFVAAGLLGIVAIPFAWAATRREAAVSPLPLGEGPGVRVSSQGGPHPNPLPAGEGTVSLHHSTPAPSMFTLLRRHNPGVVLAIGVAMGVGLGCRALSCEPMPPNWASRGSACSSSSTPSRLLLPAC